MSENFRLERDSMGEMRVPADRYWGAQTQRSAENFPANVERMPMQAVYALALVKKAAARVNARAGRLDGRRRDLIVTVCDEILAGRLDEHFPLVVWQTGSGTQSNMNVNEVIAGRGNALAGEKLLHPNDHVNMSQSSNDTYPTAMHISAALELQNHLFPVLDRGIELLDRLSAENAHIVKTGRTHLQDATPITFGQEISGWAEMLRHDRGMLEDALQKLYRLAIGGTAVGTGLNAPAGFDVAMAEELAALTGLPFVTSPNKFHALSSKGSMVFAHGALKALAADLMKMANDVRWLASGPRCGLGEISIPENEPGSSIMPGKVNPTQCESLTMIAVQVMGNDAAVGFAASQGNFELNVFMPVILYNFLQSAHLLSEGFDFFQRKCLSGLRANEAKMAENLGRSLMLVTALNPHIGYDNAAKIAKYAHREGVTLKEAGMALGLVSAEEYDRWIVPEKMV